MEEDAEAQKNFYIFSQFLFFQFLFVFLSFCLFVFFFFSFISSGKTGRASCEIHLPLEFRIE